MIALVSISTWLSMWSTPHLSLYILVQFFNCSQTVLNRLFCDECSQVGRIQSGTVSINKAVVFPGAQSTPIKQWRIGLMYSNSSSAPSDVVVPVALAYAVSQVNLVSNVDSPLYAAKGRETAVVLASQVAVDDCGQTSGQATVGLQNILKFRNPVFSFVS
jgi:hypothetical protein